MNSTIPGNTTNTKNYIFSYCLQCNVVFIAKLTIIICQSLSSGKEEKISLKILQHCGKTPYNNVKKCIPNYLVKHFWRCQRPRKIGSQPNVASSRRELSVKSGCLPKVATREIILSISCSQLKANDSTK